MIQNLRELNPKELEDIDLFHPDYRYFTYDIINSHGVHMKEFYALMDLDGEVYAHRGDGDPAGHIGLDAETAILEYADAHPSPSTQPSEQGIRYIQIDPKGQQRDITHEVHHFLGDTLEGKAIFIAWHIDDVLMVAEEMNYLLTEEEAKEILKQLDNNHDATCGITWDTIRSQIECFYPEKEDKTNE